MSRQSTATPQSYDNLHAWYAVMQRLAHAEATASEDGMYVAEPLSAEVVECISWGWVKAVQAEVQNPRQLALVPQPRPGQTRLVLLPAGRAVFESMSQCFQELGSPAPLKA